MKLFEFKPGSLILSSEMNANFAQFVEVLGARSDDENLVLPGRVAFGERQAATISALTDRAEATDGYLHFGWNAKEIFKSDGTVAVARVVNQDKAVFMRLGSNGMAVYGTTATSGDLDPSKMLLFAVNQNRSVFVHPDWSFATSGGDGITDLSDYRLTYSPLSRPVEIVNIGQNTNYNVLKELNFGVTNYHGVSFVVEANRTDATGIPPVLVVRGQAMSDLTGFYTIVNDTGKQVWQGRAFFKRSEGDTGHTLRIRADHTIAAMKVTLTGVWK